MIHENSSDARLKLGEATPVLLRRNKEIAVGGGGAVVRSQKTAVADQAQGTIAA